MNAPTDLRPRLHAMWASVVGYWETYADELDVMRADVTAAILARAALAPGYRVLETACGPAGVGLTLLVSARRPPD
ncbi:MAG: hypothetical protein ABS81_13295 [Pseudonocardia sp. SCN 72-86]|nr:MAG: hypothetical protein ABS81_13295 [Pseudonocardia sp. SCN 72-86]